MARAAKISVDEKPVATRRKPGRPPAAAAKAPAKAPVKAPVKAAAKAPTQAPVKTARSVAAPKVAKVVVPPAPKVSKDELRAQVEKLELANAKLRAKSREVNREAKAASARIAELEVQVAQLEKKPVPQSAPAAPSVRPARAKRQTRGAAPSDALPPSSDPETPAAPDKEKLEPLGDE